MTDQNPLVPDSVIVMPTGKQQVSLSYIYASPYLLDFSPGSHPYVFVPEIPKLGIVPGHGRTEDFRMAHISSRVSASPQAWEYQTVQGRLDEDRLAKLGDEGWELASVVSREDTELWVFKKPKE